MIAALVGPLLLSACFSGAPQRSGDDSAGIPGGTPGGTPGGMPGGTSTMPGSTGGTSTLPSTRGSTSTLPGRSGSPGATTTTASRSEGDRTSRSSQGARTGSKTGADGRKGTRGGDDSADDIRVATAGRPGTGTSHTDTSATEIGPDGSGPAGTDVSSAEALEAANAAVDAAADAVGKAETAIGRAREAVMAEAQGSGSGGSFDPWLNSEQGESGSPSADDGDGSDGGSADDAAAGKQAEQASKGRQQAAEESFDPFADYSDSASAQPSEQQLSEGSLQIADDALVTANSALNRARRSLIEAAVAGSADADAEAMQLAASRAALEAAAEAVVASAIAVLAAAASMEPVGEPVTDPEQIQQAMEEFAEGLAMVVGALHREMTTAAEALEATADLLTAAGSLMAMVGQAELEPREDSEGDMSAGERIASLDEQLDESLAVFDDRMTTAGSGTHPTGRRNGRSGDTPATGDTADPRSRSATADWASGDAPMDRPDVDWAPTDIPAKTRKPRDDAGDVEDIVITDSVAQDDDIVARQLREAAAAETDPELREKLWEEYYAYKESLERDEAETTQ